MNNQEIRRRNKTYEEAIEQLKKIKVFADKEITSTNGEITALQFNDSLLSRNETIKKIEDELGDNFKVWNDSNHYITYIELKKLNG